MRQLLSFPDSLPWRLVVFVVFFGVVFVFLDCLFVVEVLSIYFPIFFFLCVCACDLISLGSFLFF